jgi:hypothetical protein
LQLILRLAVCSVHWCNTVERKGDGLPQFTLFAGINVTFGK